MKKFILEKCMNYIKKNTDYNEVKLAEIKYGLEGIYLTFEKLIVIAIIAIVLGIFKEMVIFLLLFNIIRSTAFGLHATKSWICLISSTILFIGIPIISIYIKINVYVKLIICITGILLTYKNAPADTYKRPIVSKKRRTVYKSLSTVFVIVFSFLSILIKNNFMSNCFLFTIILANAMISPLVYRMFKLPYNNYINYLKKHPELAN